MNSEQKQTRLELNQNLSEQNALDREANPDYISDPWEFADSVEGEKTMFYLYKLDRAKPANKQKLNCGKYPQTLPDADQIRDEWGHGEFVYKVVNNQEKVNTQRHIYIAEKLNSKIQKESPVMAGTPAPMAPLNMGGDFLEMIKTFTALFTTVAPLFKQGSPSEGVKEAIETAMSSIRATSDLQVKMMSDNFERILEMQQRMNENAPGAQVEINESLVDKVVSVVERFAPLLQNLPQAMRQPMIKEAQKSPEFQQLRESPENIDRVRELIRARKGEKVAELVESEFFPEGNQPNGQAGNVSEQEPQPQTTTEN